MSNLTISVEDEIIKRARVRAIQQGTSVSAKIREFLHHYVNESDSMLKKQRSAAAARLVQTIEAATLQTRAETSVTVAGARKRRTLREELYGGDFRSKGRTAVKAR